MTVQQIADVRKKIVCNLAEMSSRQNMLDLYGITCENETDTVDKLSAYKWAVDSGCTISTKLWCKIEECSQEPVTFECNPVSDCSPTKVRDCKIYPKSMSVITPVCSLPADTINIIL